jgi:hypothetical protein
MKIVKTFKDGTILVESDQGAAVMGMDEYERLRLKNFDLEDEMIKRLKDIFPHCTFSVHEMKSRDYIFMDDSIELTNLSIGSIEFWMRDVMMTYDDIMVYLNNKIMPPIIMEANKVECERCKNFDYFFRHYARNKAHKD